MTKQALRPAVGVVLILLAIWVVARVSTERSVFPQFATNLFADEVATSPSGDPVNLDMFEVYTEFVTNTPAEQQTAITFARERLLKLSQDGNPEAIKALLSKAKF